MNTALKEFIEKLAKDAALQDEMAKCKSMEEAYAFASKIVQGFTVEELQSAMADIQKGSASDGELTENDLEDVSGGFLETTTWVTIGVGIAAPAAAAAM